MIPMPHGEIGEMSNILYMHSEQHSNLANLHCLLPLSSRLTNIPRFPKASTSFIIITDSTMKKRTKKSPKEVNQSNSPSPPGSSEGGLRKRVKSGLETFFNKLSNKLSSKPPSQSTSPFPLTSTGNPARETPIGKYSISSAGTRSISPSQIPRRLPPRVVRLKFHLADQGLIAHCQHRRYRLLLQWFKVSDLATQCHSSD